MIHLYHGDGKGKTTAAMGLVLRMAGRGRPVVIAQFLKGADSGERLALARLPQVTLLPVPEELKFLFMMTEDERQQEARRAQELLAQAKRAAADPHCGLVVLDEVCDGVNAGLLPLADLLELLDCARAEVVLTGRSPAPELVARADYVTRFQKEKHPYDRGIPARSGVEF